MHYLRWLMALRRTKKKEAGLKTHYLRWLRAQRQLRRKVGLEKHTTEEVSAPKRTLKEVGLGNTLPER